MTAIESAHAALHNLQELTTKRYHDAERNRYRATADECVKDLAALAEQWLKLAAIKQGLNPFLVDVATERGGTS